MSKRERGSLRKAEREQRTVVSKERYDKIVACVETLEAEQQDALDRLNAQLDKCDSRQEERAIISQREAMRSNLLRLYTGRGSAN